jgi:hypothetical protein
VEEYQGWRRGGKRDEEEEEEKEEDGHVKSILHRTGKNLLRAIKKADQRKL